MVIIAGGQAWEAIQNKFQAVTYCAGGGNSPFIKHREPKTVDSKIGAAPSLLIYMGGRGAVPFAKMKETVRPISITHKQ
jgi:hypothetical protein